MTIHIPHINAVDPSRTLTLRNRWVTEFRRRFKQLTNDIKEAIVDKDVLGIAEIEKVKFNVSPRQFDFPTDAEKIEAFSEWLSGQIELYFLTGGRQGLSVFGQTDQPTDKANNSWQNLFIDSAYQQGIRRGRQELEKAGVELEASILQGDNIAIAFNTPIHAQRVSVIYTRAFSRLKGITSSMDAVVSDALAIGLAEGKNPRQIASAINKAITGKGEDFGILDSLGRFIPAKRRAEILARTEVIRSHHAANMAEYRSAGLMGIKIKAEHHTAGDKRVCKLCEPLDEKIYTLDEAENVIPVHPGCRCVALPYIED